MADIYEGKPAVLNQFGAPVERLIYRLCRVDASQEIAGPSMPWPTLCSLSSDCWSSMVTAAAESSAVQSANMGGCRRILLQHGGQLRHQHHWQGYGASPP